MNRILVLALSLAMLGGATVSGAAAYDEAKCKALGEVHRKHGKDRLEFSTAIGEVAKNRHSNPNWIKRHCEISLAEIAHVKRLKPIIDEMEKNECLDASTAKFFRKTILETETAPPPCIDGKFNNDALKWLEVR